MPDKILAAAKGEDDEDDVPVKVVKTPVRRRPSYRDPSSDEDEEDDSESESDNSADEEEDESEDDNKPVRAWSESEMGQKGGSFTDADLYITAKYVASFPNFDEIASRDRWQPYSEKVCFRLSSSYASSDRYIVPYAISEIVDRVLSP